MLLAEAHRMVANNPQLLAERSVGAVLSAPDHDHAIGTPDDLEPIEVLSAGRHVVTYSAISIGALLENWLADMMASGYALPPRTKGRPGTDRSQRDLDVLRSMCTAGVPQDTAQAALETGSDKAQGRRGNSYVQYLMSAVWEEQ